MTFGDEYDDLLRSWSRTLRRGSENTLLRYHQSARHFRDWVATEDSPDVAEPVDRPARVADIAARHIDGWIAAQRKHGYKPGGINHRYRGLQQFLKWLVFEGELARSPMDGMKAPGVPEGHVPTVPTEDLRKLLSTCKGRDFKSTRDTAILLMFIDSGGRLSEIANLKMEDIDLKVDAAYSIGKGGKPRIHSFGDAAAAALERYLRQRAKHPEAKRPELWLGVRSGRVFSHSGVSQIIKRRCAEAGIAHINAHKFRHTMATDFLDAGGREGDLMMLMGWDSRQMIKRYTDTTARKRAVAAHKSRSLADRLL